MMEWYETNYKEWCAGEWDRPVDTSLLEKINKWIQCGIRMIFEDTLVTPSGTRIQAIHNAYYLGDQLRVLYSYKTKDGSRPGTAIVLMDLQDRQGYEKVTI